MATPTNQFKQAQQQQEKPRQPMSSVDFSTCDNNNKVLWAKYNIRSYKEQIMPSAFHEQLKPHSAIIMHLCQRKHYQYRKNPTSSILFTNYFTIVLPQVKYFLYITKLYKYIFYDVVSYIKKNSKQNSKISCIYLIK